MCGSKKSRFIKKQEASRILSNLVIKTSLNKIPLLDNIWFECSCNECNYKNE